MKPLILLIFLASVTFAQSKLPVYGSADELKDLKKVYITADEPTSRDLIIKEIKKYDGLEIVNDPDLAEFILECTVKSSTEGRGRQTSHYLRTLLTAYKQDGERQRILWSENETYEERSGFSFSRPNEVNLAKHFVSMLKKLRKK